MRLLHRAKDRLVRWAYSRLDERLRSRSPEELAQPGRARLIQTFRCAARRVPAYRRLLEQDAVDPDSISDVEQFKRCVPILDKESLFVPHRLGELCQGGNVDGIRSFFSSSGHSSTFSFGVETDRDVRQAALASEFLLQAYFGALERKTLLINCLPMGVKIHTRSLPVANTSVREDVIWALVKKLKDEFDQFILIGEHLFLKKAVEEGDGQGVPWKELTVHLVTGAEYVAENFRAYLADVLGIDFERPESGMIGINFGLSELSVSLFCESPETAGIRRFARANAEFRRALCGRDTTICPNIMQYFPDRTFMETVPGPDGRNELVVTILDPKRKLPAIRYNTHDAVDLMAYGDLADLLVQFGRQDLLPAYRLPVGVIWGKLQGLKCPDGAIVYPEQVKEALYHDFEAAAAITGSFRLEPHPAGTRLLVESSPGREHDRRVLARLAAALDRYVSVKLELTGVPYGQLPGDLGRDFERKTRYVTARRASLAPRESVPTPGRETLHERSF